jgi:hypothetical protein
MTTLPPLSPPLAPSTTLEPGSSSPPYIPQPASAPFLIWPVSRREFYRAIWLAMLPALAWGVLVYGIRSLAMLLMAVALTTLSHLFLKQWLARTPWRWPRARQLLYAHCLTSALVLVGLSHPLWPVWPVAVAALLLPLVLAALGGPGKEPVHVAVIFVFTIQFAILPALYHANSYAGGPGGTGGDAVLARDRLLMGDLRERRDTHLHQWPRSATLEGADAFAMPPPAATATDLLEDLSAALSNPETEALMPLTRRDQAAFERQLETAFTYRLPDLDLIMLGAVPNRIGAACLGAIVAAGLWLSYRYILRPRSAVIFVGAFLLGTILTAFSPPALTHAGPLGLWHVLKTFPGELVVLLEIVVLNSDLAFAAVFILALPSTEPLTPRGRRIFLVATGLLAALLHRLAPTLPAATLALCAAMPFTQTFDHLFARRSWLNARP